MICLWWWSVSWGGSLSLCYWCGCRCRWCLCCLGVVRWWLWCCSLVVCRGCFVWVFSFIWFWWVGWCWWWRLLSFVCLWLLCRVVLIFRCCLLKVIVCSRFCLWCSCVCFWVWIMCLRMGRRVIWWFIGSWCLLMVWLILWWGFWRWYWSSWCCFLLCYIVVLLIGFYGLVMLKLGFCVLVDGKCVFIYSCFGELIFVIFFVGVGGFFWLVSWMFLFKSLLNM